MTLCRITVPPASVVRLVSAVDPPTAALNVVAPEALTTKAYPPSTVPVKLTADPAMVASAPTLTLPAWDCAPVVVTFAFRLMDSAATDKVPGTEIAFNETTSVPPPPSTEMFVIPSLSVVPIVKLSSFPPRLTVRVVMLARVAILTSAH